MKKRSIVLAVFFLLALCIPTVISAQSALNTHYKNFLEPILDSIRANLPQPDITVPEGDTVKDNYVRAADSITIDGAVDGDVIVAAYEVTVNGNVTGDVIAAGEKVRINGTIGGNVRVAGEEVLVNGSVGKNCTLLAATAMITERAHIGWSLAFAGSNVTVQGPVGGSLYGYGGTIQLKSTVGTNATLILDEKGSAALEDGALISGDLNYRSDGNVTVAQGATVKGETIHRFTPPRVLEARKFLSGSWIFFKAIELLGLLVVGTIIISIFEKQARAVSGALWTRAGIKILKGLLVLLGIPLAIIVCAITIVGMPVAAIAGGIYCLLIYIAPVCIGFSIGEYILRVRVKAEKPIAPIWTMMLGTAIVFILTSIPRVGWIFSLGSALLFLGTLWTFIPWRSKKQDVSNATLKKSQ
ncbi:MAG: hypothetical protein PHY34_00790 [Patescibacteria group bacterium]|nr:hypothetical protein [Patescibacteria group bacterium]MDD5715834.1 hypothetical protein [Patescibacteria group bacterium]